jgi:hypothetical protein
MANVAQFLTAAMLVGELIGEKPNSFQEPREMRLPNSHLIVRYSTQYYRFVDHGPNGVYPDHKVVPGWADYRDGRDPYLSGSSTLTDQLDPSHGVAVNAPVSPDTPRPDLRP